MDTADAALSVLLFVILLVMNIIFYGFGVAIQNLNISDVEEIYEQKHDKRSKRILKVSRGITKYVNTVQVVVTLAQLIMGGFFLRIFISAARRVFFGLTGSPHGAAVEFFLQMIPVLLAFVLLIYILLLFGVMIPKKIAAIYPEKWAYACVSITYAFCFLLTPVTALIDVSAAGLLRLFGIRPPRDEGEVTEEEIISMLNEGHEQGVLQAAEAEMITNIFEFGDKEAQDIMTHRGSMVCVEGSSLLRDAIDFMLESNNSRFPVYEENVDHITGILHLRDAMRLHAGEAELNRPVREIEGLLREPVFIPETKNIDALFQMMQSSKTQMVIVVDEYGQTSGLLAMEDILEEIVGNLMDEYDEDEEHIEATANEDEYIIEGKTPLDELEERFGICFEEEEFETLNGFLISRMDKIPEENEEFEIEVDGYNFRIRSVENKMIQSVLVTKLKPQEGEEGSDAEDGTEDGGSGKESGRKEE